MPIYDCVPSDLPIEPVNYDHIEQMRRHTKLAYEKELINDQQRIWLMMGIENGMIRYTHVEYRAMFGYTFEWEVKKDKDTHWFAK